MPARDYLEYLRIPYQHQGDSQQGADCFGLLRMFYQAELGIELPPVGFGYPELWWTERNYLLEMHKQYGFRQVQGECRFGDVLLFKNNNRHPGHIGIVLDPSSFIHMSREGCSIACHAYGVWHRQIHGIYRYMNTDKNHVPAI